MKTLEEIIDNGWNVSIGSYVKRMEGIDGWRDWFVRFTWKAIKDELGSNPIYCESVWEGFETPKEAIDNLILEINKIVEEIHNKKLIISSPKGQYEINVKDIAKKYAYEYLQDKTDEERKAEYEHFFYNNIGIEIFVNRATIWDDWKGKIKKINRKKGYNLNEDFWSDINNFRVK